MGRDDGNCYFVRFWCVSVGLANRRILDVTHGIIIEAT